MQDREQLRRFDLGDRPRPYYGEHVTLQSAEGSFRMASRPASFEFFVSLACYGLKGVLCLRLKGLTGFARIDTCGYLFSRFSTLLPRIGETDFGIAAEG